MPQFYFCSSFVLSKWFTLSSPPVTLSQLSMLGPFQCFPVWLQSDFKLLLDMRVLLNGWPRFIFIVLFICIWTFELIRQEIQGSLKQSWMLKYRLTRPLARHFLNPLPLCLTCRCVYFYRWSFNSFVSGVVIYFLWGQDTSSCFVHWKGTLKGPWTLAAETPESTSGLFF